jgi:arsenate reductase-like glutaredoxin family protein
MDDRAAQIFGHRKSADTRKAIRFFAERRVKTHFVDFAVRGPSPGELRRFAQRFGPAALVDPDAPRFADLGLRAARFSDDRWLEMLVAEPLLLRLPLVRFGNHVAVGPDEPTWRSWFS